MPDLEFETQNQDAVIGIDEAGRGPWAGPVTVAAVWLVPQHYSYLPDGLDDSKKLSATKRERIFAKLLSGPHLYAVENVPVETIDQVGILQATLLGMRQVTAALAKQIKSNFDLDITVALVDGNISPSLLVPERLVIKGDSKSCSIAAASILAKQTRDKLMNDLATIHPVYGWERNMGYGTRQHQEALAIHGPTPHHRHSFAPIKKLIANAK